jgi:transcriptional regulator with GAF, ATPase, and Fis domain
MENEKATTGENTLARCISDCEKMVIIHALRRTGGNQADAARILGTNRRILARKISKYAIDCTQLKSE